MTSLIVYTCPCGREFKYSSIHAGRHAQCGVCKRLYASKPHRAGGGMPLTSKFNNMSSAPKKDRVTFVTRSFEM